MLDTQPRQAFGSRRVVLTRRLAVMSDVSFDTRSLWDRQKSLQANLLRGDLTCACGLGSAPNSSFDGAQRSGLLKVGIRHADLSGFTSKTTRTQPCPATKATPV